MAPRVRSQSLTRQEIVAVALRLMRSGGFARLTMRAMATELGVTPMALYYYIEGKDDLIRLVVGEVSTAWLPLQLDEDGWEESLGRHLFSVWEESARYPGLSSYLIDQPTLGVTQDALEAGIAFFERAGFDTTDARLAWPFAMTYIHGRLSVDARLGHGAEAPRLDGLHARDYVRFGVDAVIRGLKAILERQSGNRQADRDELSRRARGTGKSKDPKSKIA